MAAADGPEKATAQHPRDGAAEQLPSVFGHPFDPWDGSAKGTLAEADQNACSPELARHARRTGE